MKIKTTTTSMRVMAQAFTRLSTKGVPGNLPCFHSSGRRPAAAILALVNVVTRGGLELSPHPPVDAKKGKQLLVVARVIATISLSKEKNSLNMPLPIAAAILAFFRAEAGGRSGTSPPSTCGRKNNECAAVSCGTRSGGWIVKRKK